jgi:hypothetical protein
MGNEPENVLLLRALLRTFDGFLTKSRTAYVCYECGYEPESDACPRHPDAELIAVRLHVVAELLAQLGSTDVRPTLVRSGTVANDNQHAARFPQRHTVQRAASNPETVVDIWQEAWQALDGAAAEPSSDSLEEIPSTHDRPWRQLSLPEPQPIADRPWCQLFFFPRQASYRRVRSYFNSLNGSPACGGAGNQSLLIWIPRRPPNKRRGLVLAVQRCRTRPPARRGPGVVSPGRAGADRAGRGGRRRAGSPRTRPT